MEFNIEGKVSLSDLYATLMKVAKYYPKEFVGMVVDVKNDVDDPELDVLLEKLICEHNNTMIKDGDLDALDFEHRKFI